MYEDKATTRDLTCERGQDYGHPYHQFNCAEHMFEIWEQSRSMHDPLPGPLERCLHHVVRMILLKLSRLACNSLKADSWDDIDGYVETWRMCLAGHPDSMRAEEAPRPKAAARARECAPNGADRAASHLIQG